MNLSNSTKRLHQSPRMSYTQVMKHDLPGLATIWYNMPRLLRRPPPFRIVFHHIPKSGGTSLHQAIRRCFPLDPRIEARIGAEASARAASLSGHPLFGVQEELLLYHMALPRVAYISGHIPFSDRAFEEYGDQWSFVTLIRHPVARWLSAYFYCSHPSSPKYGRVNVSLEEHLESPAGRAWGSVCLKFFAGSIDARSTLERALQTLRRFAVVGVLEDLNSFGDAFEARFGQQLKVPHFNRNPVTLDAQRNKVAPELWRRIEDVCAPDMEFYDAVRVGAFRDS